MNFDFKNKNILITGGNKGNGLAISKAFAKNGANVIRIDKNFTNKINSTDYIFDLSKYLLIPKLIKKINSKFKHIDILINNAGITIMKNKPYNDFETYHNTLAVNLHSVFYLCSYVCPIMAKNNNGSIINK